MKQILFYALKDDISTVLESVEKIMSIKYVKMGAVLGAGVENYTRASELPRLGEASASSAIACASYLICSANQLVDLRVVNLVDGTIRHLVDQLNNPDSIVFSAGGLWSQDVLLHGRISTVSESNESQVLMKIFASELRKKFRKIKAYWVGPGAFELLEAGKRLTLSASSPGVFDLTLASPK